MDRRWDSETGKGLLWRDLLDRAVFPSPFPTRFPFRQQQVLLRLSLGSTPFYQVSFCLENRELFCLPYQCPRKGEKELWRLSTLCLGTMKCWKQAPGPRTVSSGTLGVCKDPEGGVGGGTGLSLWKHNSPWGGLLEAGRVWAGSSTAAPCLPSPQPLISGQMAFGTLR